MTIRNTTKKKILWFRIPSCNLPAERTGLDHTGQNANFFWLPAKNLNIQACIKLCLRTLFICNHLTLPFILTVSCKDRMISAYTSFVWLILSHFTGVDPDLLRSIGMFPGQVS